MAVSIGEKHLKVYQSTNSHTPSERAGLLFEELLLVLFMFIAIEIT